MLKMCLNGCSFCALLLHSILFPEDAKYWMPGIIPFNKCVATSTIFKLSVLSLWTWRTIKWFCRQSEVVERRYAFTRFMVENDRSLTAFVAGMTRRIFGSTMTWGTKVVVVALYCTNSTSSFRLPIVDSGKYLKVSSCAFNLSPLKWSLYNWRTSPKGSSKSFRRRERKNSSCIFLNTIQSICSIAL